MKGKSAIGYAKNSWQKPRPCPQLPYNALFSSLLGNVTRVGILDRTLVAGHADRGDHRRYIGNPGEDHLGAFRREVNRCRDNAGCGADRLLDAFHAGLAGHALDANVNGVAVLVAESGDID